MDTACACNGAGGCSNRTRLNLYPCDGDGHNERFAYDPAAERIRLGPGDDGPGGASEPGWCLTGAVRTRA